MLNNLVIIPCRKKSKRIKNKNKIYLGKERLFEITIKNAKKLKINKTIYLDSDDKYYSKFAEKYSINFNLRPKNLSSDKSKSIDVVLNLLKKLEKDQIYFDNIILLQTTSPFRQNFDIEKAYKIFTKKNLDSIVSVFSPTYKNKQVVFNNPKRELSSKYFLNNKNKVLIINGAIYIAKVKFLKRYKKFFGSKKSLYYLMKQSLSIDLDTNFDLYLSRKLLHNKNKLNKFDLFGN